MSPHRLLIIWVLVLTTNSTFLFAQKIPDLTGHWNGSAEIPLSQDAIIEYHFTQRGAILEGYSTAMDISGKDSSSAEFSGFVKSKSIELRQTKYLYKSGPGCLSNLKLTYSNKDGQEKLVGRWSGSMAKNTCPPGTGGKIELFKVSSPAPNPVVIRNLEQGSNSSGSTPGTYSTALYDELQKRKYYALLIGIENYEDEEIQDLDEPLSDVEELNNVLQGNYTFSPQNTVVLRNPTRDQIIDAFDDLTEVIGPTDQLLVFYAGHGIWDERIQQGYWLPSDAKRDSKSRWLSNSTIRDYIGGINSKHTLLITDACFSGSIFKERSVNMGNSRAILERYKLISRKAMTSGTLKTVPDKSVFVEYMIKNLVTNEQAMISAEDLFRTFKTAVINNSTNGQVPQYGAIGQAGDEGGDFIFVKKLEASQE